MSAQMWMATPALANLPAIGQWIKMPNSSADFSRKSSTNQLAFTNGGSDVAGSIGDHAEYDMEWAAASRDDVDDLMGFYMGLNSHVVSGKPIVYFLDPMAVDRNLASLAWGFPASAVASDGALPLINGSRPAVMAQTVAGAGIPAAWANYTIPASATFRALWVPLPPGFTLWAQAWGTSSGAGRITATPDGGAAQTVLFSAAGATNFPNSYTGAAGVTFSLAGNAGDTVALGGLMLRVYKTGTTPTAPKYIRPYGNGGCKFEDAPTLTALSSIDNSKAAWQASWKMIEVAQ